MPKLSSAIRRDTIRQHAIKHHFTRVTEAEDGHIVRPGVHSFHLTRADLEYFSAYSPQEDTIDLEAAWLDALNETLMNLYCTRGNAPPPTATQTLSDLLKLEH